MKLKIKLEPCMLSNLNKNMRGFLQKSQNKENDGRGWISSWCWLFLATQWKPKLQLLISGCWTKAEEMEWNEDDGKMRWQGIWMENGMKMIGGTDFYRGQDMVFLSVGWIKNWRWKCGMMEDGDGMVGWEGWFCRREWRWHEGGMKWGKEKEASAARSMAEWP